MESKTYFYPHSKVALCIGANHMHSRSLLKKIFLGLLILLKGKATFPFQMQRRMSSIMRVAALEASKKPPTVCVVLPCPGTWLGWTSQQSPILAFQAIIMGTGLKYNLTFFSSWLRWEKVHSFITTKSLCLGYFELTLFPMPTSHQNMHFLFY